MRRRLGSSDRTCRMEKRDGDNSVIRRKRRRKRSGMVQKNKEIQKEY